MTVRFWLQPYFCSGFTTIAPFSIHLFKTSNYAKDNYSVRAYFGRCFFRFTGFINHHWPGHWVWNLRGLRRLVWIYVHYSFFNVGLFWHQIIPRPTQRRTNYVWEGISNRHFSDGHFLRLLRFDVVNFLFQFLSYFHGRFWGLSSPKNERRR